jgi:glycine/D-amino acid oxidase-like deaminating enzyme
MAESVEAIVVGGGILGVSAALHLVEAGVSDVVLVERDDLAQATSHAGAGFVGIWAQGYLGAWKDEEVELERYGLEFYDRLAQDGYEFDYKRNGNLWAATDEEAWDTYIEPIANHPAVPDRKILGPSEVEEVTGIIAADAIHGGVLFPNGCQVSAPKATAVVADRFARAGGRLEIRRPVSRVVVENDRVTGVETAQGRVSAGIVVLAAGAWTNVLLRELGVFVPMVPLVQSRIITEPLGVPATMPTLMLQEFDFIWLREERGGLLWGSSYEVAPRNTFAEDDPPERFDHLPLDGLLKVQEDGRRASLAIPVLGRYKSMTVAQGAPCYTPDLRGMVGPVPEVEGLFVVGGCNEAGVTHGPGYGRLVADLVVSGGSGLTDAEPFRLDRFGDEYPNGPAVIAGMNRVMGTIFAGSTAHS